MAGLNGEGGITLLSGSYNSSAPATLASFVPANVGAGVDGFGCNIYTVRNGDTSNSWVLAVCVQGLHTANGTASKYASVYPGETVPLQLNEHANELQLVTAWPLSMNGTAAAAAALTVASWVTSRRE